MKPADPTPPKSQQHAWQGGKGGMLGNFLTGPEKRMSFPPRCLSGHFQTLESVGLISKINGVASSGTQSRFEGVASGLLFSAIGPRPFCETNGKNAWREFHQRAIAAVAGHWSTQWSLPPDSEPGTAVAIAADRLLSQFRFCLVITS